MQNLELAKMLFLEGCEFLQSEEYLQAEEKFKQSLINFPDRTSTLNNLSAALLGSKKIEEARLIALNLIDIDPDFNFRSLRQITLKNIYNFAKSISRYQSGKDYLLYPKHWKSLELSEKQIILELKRIQELMGVKTLIKEWILDTGTGAVPQGGTGSGMYDEQGREVELTDPDDVRYPTYDLGLPKFMTQDNAYRYINGFNSPINILI